MNKCAAVINTAALIYLSIVCQSHGQNIIRFLRSVVFVYATVNKYHFSHVLLESSGNVTMLLCFKMVI